jgi:ABC-type transporter Mla subunit MlaD
MFIWQPYPPPQPPELTMPTTTFSDPAFPKQTGDGVAQAKSKASEFGQKAADAFDDKRDDFARGINSAASSVRDRAETLPGGEKVARAARTAADAMETAGEYVRDNDLKSMFSDVAKIVKKHPGATLLTAIALGFLVSRTWSRN